MSDSTLLCPCEFFMPVAYNDGTPVEPEKLHMIHKALVRQFEALTYQGEIEGVWRSQQEKHMWVLVCIPQSRVDELKRIVAAIGKELGQVQMFFKVGAPSVTLIDITEDTPSFPR